MASPTPGALLLARSSRVRLCHLDILPIHGLAVELVNGLLGSTPLRHLDESETPGSGPSYGP